MKVADAMTSDPITVSPDDNIDTALECMRTHKIRHIPVVGDAGDLLGILSDRDLAEVPLLHPASGDDETNSQADALRAPKVDLVYTRSPETISGEDSLDEAARILLENKIGCLPVVENDALVGILTEADFVKLVLREME